jgi:hypothetical protein
MSNPSFVPFGTLCWEIREAYKSREETAKKSQQAEGEGSP